MCKLIFYLQDVSAICSALNLTAISLERFYAIVYPLQSRRLCPRLGGWSSVPGYLLSHWLYLEFFFRYIVGVCTSVTQHEEHFRSTIKLEIRWMVFISGASPTGRRLSSGSCSNCTCWPLCWWCPPWWWCLPTQASHGRLWELPVGDTQWQTC